MKIKKLIKNLTLFAPLTLSLSLSTTAVKPTILQLESFYSPFEKIYSKSITTHYPNLKYLAGIEELRSILSRNFHTIGETPYLPMYSGTLQNYQSYLISYTKSITKILALDEQIDSLRNTLLCETSLLSPDEARLLEFYEELPTILSISDCNDFIEKSKQFLEKWDRNIKSSSKYIGINAINHRTEEFLEAQSEATRNFELYLEQE